jgi:hypothetical protein
MRHYGTNSALALHILHAVTLAPSGARPTADHEAVMITEPITDKIANVARIA